MPTEQTEAERARRYTTNAELRAFKEKCSAKLEAERKAARKVLAALEELASDTGRTSWNRAAPTPSERQRRSNVLNRARAAIAAYRHAAGIKTGE